MMKDSLRWKPILTPDGIYCSPACGGRCTKSAFDLATSKAAELAARMGPGWKPNVWENLGWHWQIDKGAVQIYSPREDGYTAMFNGIHQFIAKASTPEDALGFLIQDIRTVISKLQSEVEAIA
jgi:hypothetical protein